MLRRSRLILVLLAAAQAACTTASAGWLTCSASATDAAGGLAVFTTVANVGPVKPARMGALEARLSAYVLKADPDTQVKHIDCSVSDDQLAANESYSKKLNAAAALLGWDHVLIGRPQSWLADGDIVDDPSQP